MARFRWTLSDYPKLAECLRAASREATLAVSAQASSDDSGAIRHWGELFGDEFPDLQRAGVRQLWCPRSRRDRSRTPHRDERQWTLRVRADLMA